MAIKSIIMKWCEICNSYTHDYNAISARNPNEDHMEVIVCKRCWDQGMKWREEREADG